jgi:Site-specific recombinase XerD
MKTGMLGNELEVYKHTLILCELSKRTQAKYVSDILSFETFCQLKQVICKEDVIAYKDMLMRKYKVSTTNSKIISLNRYFSWLNHNELKVMPIKVQRKSNLHNVMSLVEYQEMKATCVRQNNERNYLLISTLGTTGIRVGELAAITKEAVCAGYAIITHKGKSRHIFLPPQLTKELLKHCKKQGIETGIIFFGVQRDRALHPSSVWKLLKRVAVSAGVNPAKVYPHSLRHMFAKTYMSHIGNVFELADLLGHSSIETTRIYAATSVEEKRKSIESLQL